MLLESITDPFNKNNIYRNIFRGMRIISCVYVVNFILFSLLYNFEIIRKLLILSMLILALLALLMYIKYKVKRNRQIKQQEKVFKDYVQKQEQDEQYADTNEANYQFNVFSQQTWYVRQMEMLNMQVFCIILVCMFLVFLTFLFS